MPFKGKKKARGHAQKSRAQKDRDSTARRFRESQESQRTASQPSQEAVPPSPDREGAHAAQALAREDGRGRQLAAEDADP